MYYGGRLFCFILKQALGPYIEKLFLINHLYNVVFGISLARYMV